MDVLGKLGFLPKLDLGSVALIGIFVGVLQVLEGFRQLLTRSENQVEARNRRMRLLAKGATNGEILRLLRPVEASWKGSSLPVIGSLPGNLRRAGYRIRPTSFLLACCVATTAVTLALGNLIFAPAALAIAVCLFLLLPLHIVRQAQNKRMEKLVSQLPDALDLMARGLRVGHPLATTISSVARDLHDPAASEFGTIVDQISYGNDLVSAFADFAKRTDREDIKYMAVSVAIQHGTGGDLAQVLDTLANVIRNRISMRKRIKALSAEGRLTSVFLSSLPFLILAATSVTAPDYYMGVRHDPKFIPLAVAIAVFVSANFLIMRRLVNFRF